MKLNLGCGFKKREGWVNTDVESECNPDIQIDLEKFPWPFDDNSCDEILLEHVLEHVGADIDTHKMIMQELYRIAKPGAKISIIVPHPRSDSFLADPTHVRPIIGSTLEMYSKKNCKIFIEKQWATTPLAIYWNIDFELTNCKHNFMPEWLEKIRNKEIGLEQIASAIKHNNNVVDFTEFTLKVVKEA